MRDVIVADAVTGDVTFSVSLMDAYTLAEILLKNGYWVKVKDEIPKAQVTIRKG